MKNSVTLITILLFLTTRLFGQSDRLEPSKGIYDIYDYQFEYYSKIRRILLKDLSDSPMIRFLVKPSFSPEHVLVVQRDRTNGKYFLIYRICDKMIWHNEKPEEIRVKEYTREITPESVNDIKNLFIAVIKLTKHPNDSGLGGLDGTNYYFSANDNGMRSGETWSPNEGTKLGRLVKIGEALVEVSQGTEKLIVLKGQLKKDVQSLLAEYK